VIERVIHERKMFRAASSPVLRLRRIAPNVRSRKNLTAINRSNFAEMERTVVVELDRAFGFVSQIKNPDRATNKMFLLYEPSHAVIEPFLREQRGRAFSYQEVGASRGRAPGGYTVDHNRVRLGAGEQTFVKAVAAVRAWQMFNLGWCRVYPQHAPLEVGTVVAVVIKHFGFWSLNACRIVYLLEESGAVEKYGFAYGTLPEHGETGEERFSVEWDRESGSVFYDLYAFSRPRHPLARLGYPLTRGLQKQFASESKLSMVRAVAGGSD
jgi:uncharacterized protein (UPF0548 family)